jgi:hypothetical protein
VDSKQLLMTRTERRPRLVIQDGTIKFLGETIMPIGQDHWLVNSWSEDEAAHAVDSEEWTCSCRGFECTRACRHIEVIRRLVRELRQGVLPI